MAEAHSAHAVALQDQLTSMGTSLPDAALQANQAINRAGARTLLLAMLHIVDAAHHVIMDPEAVLYWVSEE